MKFFSHALIFLFSMWFTFAYAERAPQGLTLQGTILTPAGLPLEDASVDFVVQVRSPGAEDCLLFEESHTLNMTNSGGAFSLIIGSGARTGSNFEDTSDLSAIFSNATGTTFTGLTCASGTTYSPVTTHTRNVAITFNDGSGPQTLNQVLPVQAVPYALHADTLRGKAPSAFLQTNTTAPADLTQAQLESIFNLTSLPRLTSLLSRPATDYVVKEANGSTSVPSVMGDPAVGLLPGQMWYDSSNNVLKYHNGSGVETIGSSSTMNSLLPSQTGNSGKFLTTNGTATSWANVVTSQWATSGSDISYSAGKVGVGTTTPAEKLSVNGAIQIGSTTGTNAGTLRFDGMNFQGYNGSAWTNFVPNPPASGACDTTSSFIVPGTYTYTVPSSFGTITLRIWGGGGTGSEAYYGFPGSSGTASSINSLGLLAGGGSAGTGTGGAGGVAVGGAINLNGAPGITGSSTVIGVGGSSPNGGAGGATWGEDGQSPGGGGAGDRYGGTVFKSGGGAGAYVEKTYTPATLTPNTYISDIIVGAGGAGNYDAGVGAPGRVTIACSTAGAPPVNEGGVAFVNSGSYSTNTNFVWDNSNSRLGVGVAAPVATLDVAGAIKVGTATMTCDATKEGVFRWNTTLKKAEVCDGVAWRWLAANNAGAALTVSPNVQANMNITVGGSPGFSNYQTFIVTNVGDTTSAAIATSLSNPAYFEFGTDTCSGVTLATNATCSVQVRSKSYTDTSFSGLLNIVANNNPTVVLSGTATGSCGTLGGSVGGGVLAACYSTYALVAMPGGCADSTSNPSCSGVDIVQKAWSTENVWVGASADSDGVGNTTLVMNRVLTSGADTYPAFEFCANMTYGGYSDWYLPSINELNVLYGVKAALGGFVGNKYWSSTEKGNQDTTFENLNDGFIPSGTWGETRKNNGYYVRCVRRN